MGIKLRLCAILSYYADNRKLVEVDGNTVGECLDSLAAQFPALKKVMETAKPAKFIHAYINDEDTPTEDLSRAVKDKDELQLIFFIES